MTFLHRFVDYFLMKYAKDLILFLKERQIICRSRDAKYSPVESNLSIQFIVWKWKIDFLKTDVILRFLTNFLQNHSEDASFSILTSLQDYQSIHGLFIDIRKRIGYRHQLKRRQKALNITCVISRQNQSSISTR